jgi:hypothetical protein
MFVELWPTIARVETIEPVPLGLRDMEYVVAKSRGNVDLSHLSESPCFLNAVPGDFHTPSWLKIPGPCVLFLRRKSDIC